jgi:hypothetical protein
LLLCYGSPGKHRDTYVKDAWKELTYFVLILQFVFYKEIHNERMKKSKLSLSKISSWLGGLCQLAFPVLDFQMLISISPSKKPQYIKKNLNKALFVMLFLR